MGQADLAAEGSSERGSLSLTAKVILGLLVITTVGLGITVFAWWRRGRRADRAVMRGVTGNIERVEADALAAEQGKDGAEAWDTYTDNFGE